MTNNEIKLFRIYKQAKLLYPTPILTSMYLHLLMWWICTPFLRKWGFLCRMLWIVGFDCRRLTRRIQFPKMPLSIVKQDVYIENYRFICEHPMQCIAYVRYFKLFAVFAILYFICLIDDWNIQVTSEVIWVEYCNQCTSLVSRRTYQTFSMCVLSRLNRVSLI